MVVEEERTGDGAGASAIGVGAEEGDERVLREAAGDRMRFPPTVTLDDTFEEVTVAEEEEEEEEEEDLEAFVTLLPDDDAEVLWEDDDRTAEGPCRCDDDAAPCEELSSGAPRPRYDPFWLNRRKLIENGGEWGQRLQVYGDDRG